MAVDTLFSSVRVLVQGNSTSNVAQQAEDWAVSTVDVTAGTSHLVLADSDSRLSASSSNGMSWFAGNGPAMRGGTIEVVVEPKSPWVEGAAVLTAGAVDVRLGTPGYFTVSDADQSSSRTSVFVGTGKTYIAATVSSSPAGNVQSNAIDYVFVPEGGTKVVLSRTTSVLVLSGVAVGSSLSNSYTTPTPALFNSTIALTQPGSDGAARKARATFRLLQSTNHVRRPDPGAAGNTTESFTLQAGSSVTVSVVGKNAAGWSNTVLNMNLVDASGLTPEAALATVLLAIQNNIPDASAYFGGESGVDSFGPDWTWERYYVLELPCSATNVTWEVQVAAVQNFGGPFYMYDGQAQPGQYLVSAQPYRLVNNNNATLSSLSIAEPVPVVQGAYLPQQKTVYTATVTKTGSGSYAVYLPDVAGQPTIPANDVTIGGAFQSAVAAAYAGTFTVASSSPIPGQLILTLTSVAFAQVNGPAMNGGWAPREQATSANGVEKLFGLRVSESYRAWSAPYGNSDPQNYPVLPWPTTSIPGGGGGEGGGVTPTVWDAAFNASDTVTNSGRTVSFNSQTGGHARTTTGKTSGLWYFELDLSDQGVSGGNYGVGGVVDSSATQSQALAFNATSVSVYAANGSIYVDNVGTGVLPQSAPIIIGVELNADTRQVRFYSENGASAWYTLAGTGEIYGAFSSGATTESIATINAGQVAFEYGLPSGASPWGGGGSTPVPDVANVVLQLKGDSNLGVFPYDSSTRHYAQTVTGVVPSTSANVSGQGLSFETQPALFYSDAITELAAIGVEPFCIEMFVYQTARAQYGAFLYSGATIAEANAGYLTTTAPWMQIDANGFLAVGAAGVYVAATANVVPLNTLTHVAITRSSDGTIRGFVGGVLAASIASSGTANSSMALFGIASNTIVGSEFTGLMKDIRVTVGEAVYTESFTPIFIGQATGGGSDVQGAGYNTVDEFTSTGQGNQQATFPPSYGSGSVTLDDFTADQSVVIDNDSVNGTSNVTLAAATNSGTGLAATPTNASGSTTLDDFTSAASGVADVPVNGTGDGTVEDVVQDAVGLFLAPSEGFADILLEEFSSTGVGEPQISPAGYIDAAMRVPTVFAYGQAKSDNLTVSMPSATATARGRGVVSATMRAATASASGTVTNIGRVAATMPLTTVESTGRVSGTGSAQVFMPSSYQLVGYGGGVLSATVEGYAAQATGISGTAGGIAATLPMVVVEAVGKRDNSGQIAAEMPMLVPSPSGQLIAVMPMVRVIASGSAVVTVTHEAYVLNMGKPMDDNPRNNFEAKNDQMTRYTNFPFTQVVRYLNSYYGVAADGLYLLEGTTDNGAPIGWDFDLCMTDFGSSEKKNVAAVYLGGQAGPTVDFTIQSGETADQLHAHTTTAITAKRNHRQKFGLGRRTRYYSLGLSGQGDLAIDSIEFEVANTTRRI